MPFKPEYEGEVPTLGWHVLEWITSMLAAPDKAEYEPFTPTPEQAQFILNFYALDPDTGARRIRRGVISRPRGWGKSPFLAAVALAEALASVVPDGWDSDGRPVGKPWDAVRTPLVQISAVSEKQTQNSWTPLLEMIREGPVMQHYAVDPMESFVALPRGRIEPITASATSVKGNKAVFGILDQTEVWSKSNGGIRLADTLRINAAKLGGSIIESPNAYTPGDDSVAERTAAYHKLIIEGKAREDGLLYDHREAPADTDMAERESLTAGLRHVYGDSAQDAGGWVDLSRIVADIWDPATDPQLARADFLNQITHASDSWFAEYELKGAANFDKAVTPGEAITLGFDGSRKRARGVADSTALIGCRVSDGHIFQLGVWEQPDGQRDWEVPKTEVHAAVHDAFQQFTVVGFLADPARWESDVSDWEAKYGKQLRVKGSAAHPIEFWMSGGRAVSIVRATERLHNALMDSEATYDGSAVLTRHFLNARRRPSQKGLQIAKEYPDSPRKIDAAVASILAFESRSQAVAQNLGSRRKSRRVQRF